MADKHLSLNQQISLLPVAIPDSVVDFLEDFNYATALQTENGRSAFDPEYLKNAEDNLKSNLENLRTEMGKLLEVHVDPTGRDVPGGFLLKLTFEKGPKGIGLLTRLKERTIIRLMIAPGPYDEAHLKELLKNPK